MRITAVYHTQVAGVGIVRRGSTIDLDESQIDERIAANFIREDGSPIVRQKRAKADGEQALPVTESPEETEHRAIDKAVKVIGRDGIMRKLDEMGITYKPTHKTEYLAKLLLEAQGEI